ncbi:Tat (twin-arginine translocation) pathway signal sequence containing protein [Robertkochia aurantiaca]|uniref:Tat (twin-arginine translocation) pathway signal sequence containing protein n=1 Tax=Robertkochia aurantiaca TaxID=2873700 RepID=UPI001CCA1C72|nr:Tat (twin-arginine translocation) pathway signal sequence containing protein [Robertkochia sp. 3YJGBD-33]
MEFRQPNSRRGFMETMALGATGVSLSLLAGPLMAKEALSVKKEDLINSESWFDKIKGSHRVVYDGSTPHQGLPIAWTYVFYMTNNMTDTPDEDMTAVCVLRHSAIPFALNDEAWKQYKLGEFFEINDNQTGNPALRNMAYMPQKGDFPVDEIQGIKQLQERGAMFCVCDLALKVYGGFAAQKMGLEADKVYQDWKAAVIPGIEIVPSGVWALTRAQEKNCGYIFAGE